MAAVLQELDEDDGKKVLATEGGLHVILEFPSCRRDSIYHDPPLPPGPPLSLEARRPIPRACVRTENLLKAAVEGAYKQRSRARYLSLRRKVLETHGLELDAALLMQLRGYFFN
ncbi:hypothetical protein TRAPUB_9348 [Trametes pubescens]|uniref:Uncharacterized protein n=1 Tax=Trametes pubescens TaxID=154538 RepID=A0A1M2W2R3_TRAPU|nr:hypothetical protein TRAPUB_9348 [Trametes pubescens]